MGIVIGSTFKGLIVGALVGWYATRVQSLPKGLLVGLLVAAFFAFLIAVMPNPEGRPLLARDHDPGIDCGTDRRLRDTEVRAAEDRIHPAVTAGSPSFFAGRRPSMRHINS